MTPDQFIAKWKAVELKERSAAQSHFIDLCHMLDEPAPTDAIDGQLVCIRARCHQNHRRRRLGRRLEAGSLRLEYQGKRKDLNAAFAQLQQYALALKTPPLLVVSFRWPFSYLDRVGTAKAR